MEKVEKKNPRKKMEGYVVSTKMDKTIVVSAVTNIKHSMLGKYMIKKYKIKAHDENNAASEGDKVLLEEVSRPLSKTKRWILKKIVEKAQ